MATKLKEVDVLLVGLGWTGGILAKELTEAGTQGRRARARRACAPPKTISRCRCIRDELRFARATTSCRTPRERHADDTQQSVAASAADAPAGLVPARRRRRRRGRALERRHVALDRQRTQMRSLYEERYGKNYIPADMTIQDWGITYAELEPYYDKFEYTAGGIRQSGQHRGAIQPGGNPFEGPRAREYPLPPLTPEPRERDVHRGRDQSSATIRFRVRRANASRAYTNPDGIEVRRVPVLRLLRALRLRSEREGQPAHHGDSDRHEESEFRTAHARVGDKSAEGLHRQARDRRHLHQRAERRGIRAARAAWSCCARTRSTTCT